MSNFAFLNNKDFLKHPSCAVLYEYARAAEASYFDHEKCALKVRFILEQFCIFVSELKNASYPEKIFMLGQYWGNKNQMEFLRIFGYENVTQIKRANTISRSFLHSMKTAREDIYPEMLESIYILLLWLYKELGFHTSLKYSDYSVKKISSDTTPFAEPAQDIFHSPENFTRNLKILFPNCNTDQLCSVTKQDNRYIITDISGSRTEKFIESEKYDYSQKEQSRLKKQLEQAGEQFEAAKNEFLEKQNSQEMLILELKAKIKELKRQTGLSGSGQEQNVLILQSRVEKRDKERPHMAETYKKSLRKLGNRYDDLQEKYEELIPLKEKKLQMQQQITDLIQEREYQEKIYADTQAKLLKEVSVMKKKLSLAQQDLLSMGTSAKESQKLIRQLQNRLSEKEKELLTAQSLAKKQFEKLQAETEETIQKYKDKANSLEIILTDVMAENARFREQTTDYRHVENVKNYLQLVNQGISQIEDGYALYRQNQNEQKLREYLWEVKTYYDDKIESLEKALKEKEEKLAQEQQKNSILFETIWEENTQIPKYKTRQDAKQEAEGQKNAQKKIRRKWPAALAASFLILFLTTLPLLLKYPEIFSAKNPEDDTPADHAVQNDQEDSEILTSHIPSNTSEDLVNAANAATEKSEPQENDESQEKIPTPEETGSHLEESQPEQTIPALSSDISSENSDDPEKRLADQLLEDAQKERERVEALPDTIAEISGVSQDLLDDMETMRGIFRDFFRVASPRYGEETEDFHSIGAYQMFGGTRTLYQIDSLKISKFVYCRESRTGFRLAVEPDAVSGDVSYHTSLEELENILGEADIQESNYYSFKPTDFSEDLTDGKYIVTTFDFDGNSDSQESSKFPLEQELKFVYNEERNEMLDYAYVFEHVGW